MDHRQIRVYTFSHELPTVFEELMNTRIYWECLCEHPLCIFHRGLMSRIIVLMKGIASLRGVGLSESTIRIFACHDVILCSSTIASLFWRFKWACDCKRNKRYSLSSIHSHKKMYHGTLSMYHGRLLMYHGTFSYGFVHGIISYSVNVFDNINRLHTSLCM